MGEVPGRGGAAADIAHLEMGREVGELEEQTGQLLALVREGGRERRGASDGGIAHPCRYVDARVIVRSGLCEPPPPPSGRVVHSDDGPAIDLWVIDRPVHEGDQGVSGRGVDWEPL